MTQRDQSNVVELSSARVRHQAKRSLRAAKPHAAKLDPELDPSWGCELCEKPLDDPIHLGAER